MKRFIALFLAVILTVSMGTVAFAAETESAPVAIVERLTGSDRTVKVQYFGASGVTDLTLDTGYEFTAPHTGDEAAAGAYAKWNADFVVSLDKSIDADTICLAGQYNSYSENWLAFNNTGLPIEAGTEYRLLKDVGGISMTYTELCSLVGVFKCGAKDISGTGALDNVTLKVELRLFETGEGSATIANETGESVLIGTYSYTFGNVATVGGKPVSGVDEIIEEVSKEEEPVIELPETKGNTAVITPELIEGVEGAENNEIAISVPVNEVVITFDNAAVKEIAKSTDESEVVLNVEKLQSENNPEEANTDAVVYEISLTIDGEGVEFSEEGKGSAKIRAILPEGFENAEVYYYPEDESEEKELIDSEIVEIDGVEYVEFFASHFSKYGLEPAEAKSIVLPTWKPSGESGCDHEFDENNVCKECGVKVTQYVDGKPVAKPEEETNPNTGAESAVSLAAAVAVVALAGAVISKRR